MATRSRKEEIQYKKHRDTVHKKVGCIFCAIDQEHTEVVQESKSFYVVKNRFPYSHWDGQGVIDHLMIVPKKHTDTLSDLDSNEAIEYIGLLSSYENKGYNVYARAPQSVRKTVIHQHTHLIKLDGTTINTLVYIRRPYIRITR